MVVEITLKIKTDATDTNQALLWLEELAKNEMFEFDVVKTEKV